MRVAMLGFHHESNTFAPVPATLERFLEVGPVEGDGLLAEHASAGTTLAGFIEAAADDDAVDAVPLVFFDLNPMGTITAEAFEHISHRLVGALDEHGPWDAVLLMLHGAAVSQDHPDADGEMLRRVRAAVGDDVVIGVTYDMHANVTSAMVHHADVVNAYITNPHVDARARANAVAGMVFATVRGELRPAQALAQIPLAVNILRQGTSDQPMADLVALAAVAEQRSGVLSVSVVEGFPYADVAELGMSVIAVTDHDSALAAEVAGELAEAVWARRDELTGTGVAVDDGLRRAAASAATPVVVLDVGDNVGAGSPADSTHVLAAAQRLGLDAVFGSLCDPRVAQQCHRLGVGARVDTVVGGATDSLHGEPLAVRGVITHLDDGRFEDPGPTHGGRRMFDAGPRAVIRTDDGLTVLVTSRPMGNTSRQELVSAGIDPSAMQVIVAKGVHSPRAAFEPIAAEMIQLDSAGCTTADIGVLAYTRRRTPIYPFEQVTEFVPRPITR